MSAPTVGTTRTDQLPPACAEELARVLAGTAKPALPSGWSAALTFGWRAVLKIKHVPERLLDMTLFPIIVMLMYTFVLGSALAGSVSSYQQYLVPGMVVLSTVMLTMDTGVSIKADISKGVFDRFRAMPIWRPAPMVGYLFGDLFRYATAATVMLGAGLIGGYRPHGGVPGIVAALAVLVAFCFALSWIWTTLGLLLRSEDVMRQGSIAISYIITACSNILVSPATMPGWLQGYVTNSPISHLTTTVRGLMAGHGPAVHVAWAVGWAAVIVALFAPLAIRLYNRT